MLPLSAGLRNRGRGQQRERGRPLLIGYNPPGPCLFLEGSLFHCPPTPHALPLGRGACSLTSDPAAGFSEHFPPLESSHCFGLWEALGLAAPVAVSVSSHQMWPLSCAWPLKEAARISCLGRAGSSALGKEHEDMDSPPSPCSWRDPICPWQECGYWRW